MLVALTTRIQSAGVKPKSSGSFLFFAARHLPSAPRWLDQYMTSSTDFKRQLCTEYLVKLQEGKLEPAEQGVAAAMLGNYIRILENGCRALNNLTVPDDTVEHSER
jgi:hypothetical protein